MLQIRRSEGNQYVLPALTPVGRRSGTAAAIWVGGVGVTCRYLREPVDNVPVDSGDAVSTAWLHGSADQLRLALIRAETNDSTDEVEAWLADFL